jgi:hypothetical protein
MAAESIKQPFVPPFFARLGVKPGEWMYTTKPSMRALMRPSWPLKVRIWACLMIQSFGYESDLAVIMSKGEYAGAPTRVGPLQPSMITGMIFRAACDACAESGIQVTPEIKVALRVSKAHMHRALVEMEQDDGLIVRARLERTPEKLQHVSLADGEKRGWLTPLRKLKPADLAKLGSPSSRIGVFLLPKPNKANNLRANGAISGSISSQFVENAEVEEGGPIQLLLAFMRNHSMRKLIADAGAIAGSEEVKAAVLSYHEVLRSAADSLKRYLEQAIQAAKTPGKPQPAPPLQPKLFAPASASVGTQASAGANGIGNPPRVQPGTAPGAGLSPAPPVPAYTSAGRPVSPAGKQAEPLADVAHVLDGMRHFCPADEDAARIMIAQCRGRSPHCTAVEILGAIRLKGHLCRGKDSPVGFLLTAVPKLFSVPVLGPQPSPPPDPVYVPENFPECLAEAKRWLADPACTPIRRRNAQELVDSLDPSQPHAIAVAGGAR